jgi:predicted MPP superfamily phosphohydrolase
MPLLPLAYIMMGVFAISITVFVLIDIVNILNLALKIKTFRYYSTIAAIVLSIGFSIAALINFATVLHMKEIKIKIANLPVDSLRIAAIADLHINAATSPKTINDIFDKALSLNPDMIVLVGDIIDTDINKNDKFIDYGFEKLKAKYGVFAVTGNHEYYTGVNVFYEMFKKLGVKVLSDESVLVNRIINVAGINDKSWDEPEKIRGSLISADPRYPILFLSHRPETFNVAADMGKEIVQISGHTHGGQIPPIWIIREFFMQYNYGIYKTGRSTMFVTSGTRLWGPPMRLFSSSEIALIILERG